MIFLVSCEGPDLIKPVGFETDMIADSVIFAQIGDFGMAGNAEKEVADLVKSWNPDFIITSGDNNYYDGKLSSIIANISNYYSEYIDNFDAPEHYRCHGKAASEHINRFFPTPGNHDANNKDGLIPYYNFFTLPETEVYYKFIWGPASFYSINCIEGDHEQQKQWLEQNIATSNSRFNIVFFHYPPYSSGSHGNNPATEWDYFDMGVDVVFCGHDHIYNRIEKKGQEGMYYIVNGLGGKDTDGCSKPLPSDSFNSFCYGSDYGAIRGTLTHNKIILEFYAVSNPGVPVDKVEIVK